MDDGLSAVGRKRTYYYLHMIVLLGFLTAGLFPQCAQSSPSKIFMEICTAEGIEIIALDGSESDQGKTTKPRKPCPYCFSAHMDQAAPDAPAYVLALSAITESYRFPEIKAIRFTPRAERYDARAPPYAV